MDARLQYLTTQDKTKLYYQLWVPDNPQALIIFIPGLGDHIGRYNDFIKYFVPHGFGICLYDQRGHGRSSGRRSHCKYFTDFLRDLAAVVQMVQGAYPNALLFLMGHSFGAQVAINFVAKYSKGFRGLIALSPNIEPAANIKAWKKKLTFNLSRWLPIVRFSVPINPAYLSHDDFVIGSAITDPLMNWHVTARLGTEILKNLMQLPKIAFQVKVPCFFLQGSDDRVTSLEATRKFYHSILIQNKDLKIYPGLYHELLNETERLKVFQDIESWLNGQLVSFKRLAKAEGNLYETKKNLDLWHHTGGFNINRA